MTTGLTSDQVWEVIEKQNFGVLAMVTAKDEARTAGIVYILGDRRLYIGTWTSMWKVRHVQAEPARVGDDPHPQTRAVHALDQGPRGDDHLQR